MTLPPLLAHALAGGGHVRHTDRDMAEGGAELVALDAVVVGELEHRRALLVVVADEGERILLLGAIGGAQQLHAEHLGVEVHRALHVADAQHGVQEFHVVSLKTGKAAPASSRRSRAASQSG